MYCYIYDDFLQDKRYEREMVQIENRLTDLGLTGKIARLALFRDPAEMIRDEIDRGVKTVVVIGNDSTVHKVLDVVADTGTVFGIIPVGPLNHLARILGVPTGVEACNALSARIIESIDIGTVNGRRFITSLSIPDFRAELTCEGKYRVFSIGRGALDVRNLASCVVTSSDAVADPSDGLLETSIRVGVRHGWGPFSRQRIEESVLPLASMAVRSEQPVTAYVDGVELRGTRFDIGVEPKVLRVIVGRDRAFTS